MTAVATNQGRGLYPRVRDYHNTHGSSVVFRTDAQIPMDNLGGLMVAVRREAIREFDGLTLTRKQIGGAVEQMKAGWRKWNRHVNAVVVTAYDPDKDKSAVMLGILIPARHESLFSSENYDVYSFDTEPTED